MLVAVVPPLLQLLQLLQLLPRLHFQQLHLLPLPLPLLQLRTSASGADAGVCPAPQATT